MINLTQIELNQYTKFGEMKSEVLLLIVCKLLSDIYTHKPTQSGMVASFFGDLALSHM